MSTLGTFARYSDFMGTVKVPEKPFYDPVFRPDIGREYEQQVKAARDADLANRSITGKYQGTEAQKLRQARIEELKSKTGVDLSKGQKPKNMTKKAKIGRRNLAIGAGLGLAALGTLGAIAYNNRDSRNRRAEMGFGSAFANFAEKRTEAKTLGLTGLDTDTVKAIRESRDKVKAQKAIERSIDAGDDIYKGATGMGYVTRTGALLGSPERALIQAGKASENQFIQGLAKGAEKAGRLGYKTGAIGARGVLNKAVGRTLTGKAARLGVAGLGLSAIGGAMKRNRQEQG